VELLADYLKKPFHVKVFRALSLFDAATLAGRGERYAAPMA
jgi:hypothetical protein